MSEVWKLEVDRAELLDTLAQIRRLRNRFRSMRISLLYEDGELVFASKRFRTRVSAKGEWCGEVCIAVSWLHKLVEIPPAEDPVVVTYSDGRVGIGEGSVAEWRTR